MTKDKDSGNVALGRSVGSSEGAGALYKIGAEVWLASFARRGFYIQCPNCCGTRKLKITFGDGTEAMIDCSGCQLGYEPPRGEIQQYEWSAEAKPVTITSVTEKMVGPPEYRFAQGYYDNEGRTFANKAEAVDRADELKATYQAEENARLMHKTKDERTWSWNATYHRGCIKQAEKDLEYHRRKFEICQTKARKERAPAPSTNTTELQRDVANLGSKT